MNEEEEELLACGLKMSDALCESFPTPEQRLAWLIGCLTAELRGLGLRSTLAGAVKSFLLSIVEELLTSPRATH